MALLADEQQGLDLTLADQKAFDGLEYSLAPLVRIQGLPGRLLHRHLQ